MSRSALDGRPVSRRHGPVGSAVVGLAAVLLAASLAACTAHGGSGASGDRATTSTPAPATTNRPGTTGSTGSTGSPATTGTTGTTGTTSPNGTGGGAPDPRVDDVPDDTYRGLGDPRIDVGHYAVLVRSDPGRRAIRGVVTITLAARTTAPLRSFTLDLRGPKISRATVDGRPAKVAARAAEVTITPAKALRPGRAAKVVIRYAGVPRTTNTASIGQPIGWQTDDEGGTFTMSEPDGTSTWVPVSDHPSDLATWRITLDVPAGLTGVANGRLLSKAAAKGRRRWVWDQDRPMASYLALAAVGRTDLVERPGPDGTHLAFAFPHGLPAAGRKGADELDGILRYFSATFGPYPDDDAGFVIVPTRLGVALETQTRPLFGLDAVQGDRMWALAHEVAHQWFGDAVALSQWHDLWLNEGFATYADWLYMDHTGEVPMKGSVDDAYTNDRGTSGLSVLDPRAAGGFDPLVYDRGALTLHALRLTVGDARFFAILKAWFASHTAGNVTTDDFIALATRVGGAPAGAVLQLWLHAKERPTLPG